MRNTLSTQEYEHYLNTLPSQSRVLFTALRTLILQNDKNVTEYRENGKWLHEYLKYKSVQGNFVYALGVKTNGTVSLHAMPYYGSSQYQEKYQADLKIFISGKSCFDFTSSDVLPIEPLVNIMHDGSTKVDEAVTRIRNGNK